MAAQGWAEAREYVDKAPAGDLAARVNWRACLEDASRRQFDLLLLWRLDRGFRSVLDAAQTLERLRAWGVGLRSYQEPWLDTTSPFGEALYYITAAYAQLERAVLAERVKAGMARASREGKRVGRPPRAQPVTQHPMWAVVVEGLEAGHLSRAEAARKLHVRRATLDGALRPV